MVPKVLKERFKDTKGQQELRVHKVHRGHKVQYKDISVSKVLKVPQALKVHREQPKGLKDLSEHRVHRVQQVLKER